MVGTPVLELLCQWRIWRTGSAAYDTSPAHCSGYYASFNACLLHLGIKNPALRRLTRKKNATCVIFHANCKPMHIGEFMDSDFDDDYN